MAKERRKLQQKKTQEKPGRLGWTVPGSEQDVFLNKYIPAFHNAQATKRSHPGGFDEFWSSTHAAFTETWSITLTEEDVKCGLTVEDKWKTEHRVS